MFQPGNIIIVYLHVWFSNSNKQFTILYVKTKYKKQSKNKEGKSFDSFFVEISSIRYRISAFKQQH